MVERPKQTFLQRHKMAKNTGKDDQHHSLLEKCKSNLQWSITSHWSEWLSSKKKKLQKINAEEDVEERKPSFTVGENIHWYNQYGEQYGDSYGN